MTRMFNGLVVEPTLDTPMSLRKYLIWKNNVLYGAHYMSSEILSQIYGFPFYDYHELFMYEVSVDFIGFAKHDLVRLKMEDYPEFRLALSLRGFI